MTRRKVLTVAELASKFAKKQFVLVHEAASGEPAFGGPKHPINWELELAMAFLAGFAAWEKEQREKTP